MFLSRNKKNNVYPCKPQFYYIKVGFNGVNIIQICFRDVKIQISLRECAACSESSLGAHLQWYVSDGAANFLEL